MTQLVYKVAKLWGKSPGETEKYILDEKVTFPEDKDLKLASNFTGELTFIRLKDEISALLNDGEIDVNFTCNKCLKSFAETVSIPSAEREFFYDKPDFESSDLDDLFYIHKRAMTIDLNEMVRQEIILHFPLIPVCSSGCKGLCAVCGKDNNIIKCRCTQPGVEEENTHLPFKNLKEIAETEKKKPRAKKQ